MLKLGTLNESLTAKLLAIYLATVGASIAVLMGVFEIRSYTEQRGELVAALEQLVEVQGSALAAAVWELDQSQVRAVLNDMSNIPHLRGAAVKDESGAVIARVGNPYTEAEAPDLMVDRELVQNAFGDDIVVGSFSVVFSTAAMWAELADRLTISALILIVVAAALTAATIFITRRVIGRPVAALRRSIDRMSQEGELEEVRWQSADELGRVVVAYNDMQSELKRYQNHLENLVAERTEQLERQNSLMESVLASMAQGLAAFGKDLKLTTWNRQFMDMLDYPDDIVTEGQSLEQFLRFDAERGEFGDLDAEELIARRLEFAERKERDSVVHQRPNGDYIEVRSGNLTGGGVVMTFTDITEIKAAEAALKEANTQVTEQNQMLESLSSQLAKYLSPQVYASIFSGEQSVEIQSKRKKLTVFFSDIAGFTETTDRLESEELTALLNHYLTEMSTIALEHGATIDKFVGDAIMAFFGDPETKGPKQDAIACVEMAIAMQRRMDELQAEWRERGQEHVFQVRIGVNTGYCTVGNFGSPDRMDYTIIGNEVNLAARLQEHADLGGILMTHETYSLVGDAVMAEETGTISMKGIAEPVRTYRLLGLHEDLAAEDQIIRADRDGLSLVIDRRKLTESGKPEMIKALEDVLSQLRR